MCKNKHAIKGSLLLFGALVASVFVSTLISGKAFAAMASDLVTGEDGVRWEYTLSTGELGENEPQKLFISFYDKPADLTTVTVPSLSYLISHISGATNDLDTYFLTDADTTAQDTAYGSSYPRIVTSTPTTVLDMTNTSKIQIRGVKPIIDPDIETELIFGENMVIGDTYEKASKISVYGRVERYKTNWSEGWRTYDGHDVELNFESLPGWNEKTLVEKINYWPTYGDYGCLTIRDLPNDYVSEEGKCYIYASNDAKAPATLTFHGGTFSGYRLKLTNFEEQNFNYIGYQAFKDSILDEDHTTMTITGDAFAGGFIFEGANIEKAIINTNTYGTGLFKNCQSLTQLEVADNVDYLHDDTFAGTNFPELDFSRYHIKRIGARAFEGAQVAQIDFTGVERIDYRAFKDNHVTELYLPKSINYLQSALFENNNSIKKITIAYDTLSSGTTLPLWVVLRGGNHWGDKNDPLEEVNLIAPYAANEPVSATHVTYDDYRWGFNTQTQEHTGGWQPNRWGMNSYGLYGHASTRIKPEEEEMTWKFETDYANYDAYKNILAPLYFTDYWNLKKVTIGEGYEYIGSSAFYYTHHIANKSSWPLNQKASGLCDGKAYEYVNGRWTYVDYTDRRCGQDNHGRYLEEIKLPETLKGVGNLAFQGSYALNMKVNLPRSLEFIGVSAFQELYHMSGDFDLPNVKYIGDFAFDGTSLRDVTIHDSVVYWGNKAFSCIPTIRNITLDLDLFSQDKIIPWTWVPKDEYTGVAYDNGDPCQGLQYFRMQFGPEFGNWTEDEEKLELWGIRQDYTTSGLFYRFGKITFTDKVVAVMEMMDHDNDGSSSSDVFFGEVAADEVDMGAMTEWKILPRKFFTRGKFGKVTLPPNLEVIGHDAFNNTILEQELVLPDSIKIIGTKAFESYNLISHQDSEYVAGVGRWYTDTPYQTPVIKKLPASLEYVGYEAFWGDQNMTANLDAPNLKHIGPRAFMNTGIRDVLIPNGVTGLREAAFAASPNLRNIIIDADLNTAYTTATERYGTADYTLPSYLIEWAGSERDAQIEVDAVYLENNCSYYDQQLAAGYYETHPESLQYVSSYCKDSKPFETLYTVFNKQGSLVHRTDDFDHDEIISFAVKEGQDTAGDTFGTLTFGPHATTDITTNIGAFSFFGFEEVDLGQTGWTKLTKSTDAFYSSKIGTIILPSTIETINYASFMKAEVTNPITIPASVRTIDTSAFQWAKIGGLDIKEGLEEIKDAGFLWSEIGGEFALPSTLKTLEHAAFMESKGYITNMLPEGVEFVGNAAFYQTDMADELTIPSTVTTIEWSAFNANNVDVHYDKVTIKPDLTYESAANQLVHQMLWKVDFDELVVESNMLVGLDRYADSTYYQEFYNLKMDKVTITNLPKITRGAFDKCHNLVEVDLSKDANLDEIKTEAFLDDEKLHIIKFSPAIKNKTVTLGQRILVNTAFETMGDSTKEFDLTAAKFVTPQSVSFAWMPKLRTVDIPNGFNNNVIEMATFYNDPELKEVTVGYKISLIDEGAFANDTKIEKIFIWGNTVVNDSSLDGYEAPSYFGRGGDGDDVDLSNVNPDTLTIPGQADVYAYSVSPTESYASYSRNAFTGTFYPLDEVLYLTSNKPTVLLNDDETDFDKSDLIVYGLRRDGVVLESDSWAEYDGVAYARSARPLTFEKMADTIAADPAFGTVYDTPVPLAELDFGNENFADIDFAIVPAQDDPAVRIVNIVYTDGYTGGEPDTDIDPRQEREPEPTPDPTPTPDPEEPETPETPETPDTPKTNDELGQYIALLAGSAAAGLGLVGWYALSRRKR